MLPCEAVVFDVDGILLDTERLYHEEFVKAIGLLGADLEPHHYYQMVGRNPQESRRDMMALMKSEEDWDHFEGVWNQQIYDRVDASGIPFRKGALEVLDWVNQSGVNVALATSSSGDWSRKKLKVTGLSDRIEVIVMGDCVRQGKPAPDIYLETAQRLRVQPERVLAVEDSNAGVLAAHRAKMRVVMVPDLLPPDDMSARIAFKIVDCMTQVPALLGEVVDF